MRLTRNWLRIAVGLLKTSALAMAMTAGSSQAEEVVFVGWSQTEVGLKPTLERLFNEFQAAHPADKLEVIGFPFDKMEQNLVLRQRNSQRIDVAQLQERWLPSFAKMNALHDLNQVFGADVLASRFDPEILKLGQVNGKQVGIPFTAGAVTLVGNRNVLQAAGVTSPPRTLTEFTAALRKVKAFNKDLIPFGFSTKGLAPMHVEATIMFWAHGARFFDDQGRVLVDSPQSRAALKYLADLVNEGLIAKGNDRFDTRKLYSADKVAFFLDPPVIRGFVRAQAGGPSADGKIMILPVPTINSGDTPRALFFGHFLAMFNHGGVKGTADTSGSKLLTAIGMDTAAQRALWQEGGQIPTMKAAVSAVASDPYVKDFVTATKTAWWDETAQFVNGGELRQIIAEEVEAGMLGVKSVDDAIRSMSRRLDSAVKRAR